MDDLRHEPPDASAEPGLLEDALAGLSADPKTLSPKWLYDDIGSRLFDRITRLPEYYLTRTETALIAEHAERLAALVPPGGALVELGAGSGTKTRLLLDHGKHFGAYLPVDISEDFLLACAAELKAAYPEIRIRPVTADFTKPVDLPGPATRRGCVGFFPGSTIGNVSRADATALLRRARSWPCVRAFVLGVDLVKDPATLVAAYDDAQGVTARFIGNALARLNRDLGADFDLDAFRYEARWDAGRARIEMRLVSRRAQAATLGGRRIRFAAGEPILVSQSRKFTPESLARLCRAAGWTVAETLTDRRRRLALAILRPGAVDEEH